MKSKQQIKSMVYLKQNLWFFIPKYLQLLLLFLKLCVQEFPFLFPRTFPFKQSQVTSSWFQKQQELKIQTNYVP
jgi:hypothetical protein